MIFNKRRRTLANEADAVMILCGITEPLNVNATISNVIKDVLSNNNHTKYIKFDQSITPAAISPDFLTYHRHVDCLLYCF